MSIAFRRWQPQPQQRFPAIGSASIQDRLHPYLPRLPKVDGISPQHVNPPFCLLAQGPSSTMTAYGSPIETWRAVAASTEFCLFGYRSARRTVLTFIPELEPELSPTNASPRPQRSSPARRSFAAIRRPRARKSRSMFARTIAQIRASLFGNKARVRSPK